MRAIAALRPAGFGKKHQAQVRELQARHRNLAATLSSLPTAAQRHAQHLSGNPTSPRSILEFESEREREMATTKTAMQKCAEEVLPLRALLVSEFAEGAEKKITELAAAERAQYAAVGLADLWTESTLIVALRRAVADAKDIGLRTPNYTTSPRDALGELVDANFWE